MTKFSVLVFTAVATIGFGFFRPGILEIAIVSALLVTGLSASRDYLERRRVDAI